MARINLCPNPSLTNDATGFFGGGARVTGATGMVRSTAYQNSGATSTLPRFTVTAGQTYRASAYVKGTGGGSSGNANINWYSGGVYLSSAPGQGWDATTGNVTRVESGAQVAPATADQGLLNITGADAQHQVTGILYENTSSLLEFFDGASPTCSWNGTAGNSTSTSPDEDVPDEPPVGGGGGGGSSDEAGVTQSWGEPIFYSDFNDPGELDGEVTWGLYDGPGHGGNGTRDPERISIVDSLLRLQGTAGGSTGGMAHQLGQQYGRWEARMRAYSTGGTGGQEQYHPVLIVWPDSGDWPTDGEYDFIETDVGESIGAYIHYPHPDLPVQQEHTSDGDTFIADWHNYAIDWQPTGITGYLDGVQWYHYSGGAGPAGRSNIQDMPSGHLTVQLDNFGGSPHRPANMDLDWVKIWDADSFGSNTDIGPSGIPSASPGGFSGFGNAVVGNRFRLYLNNTDAAITTAPHTSWEQTAGAITGKALGTARTGANTSVTIAETSTSNVFDSMQGQWISPPFTSSGTFTGPWQAVWASSETADAADFTLSSYLRIVSNDGTVVRGLPSIVGTTLPGGEITTVLSGRKISVDLVTPVAVQQGDRLVLELGFRSNNTVNTSYSSTIRYGGTVGDLEAGDTGATATTASGWIEFADGAVKALFTGQTMSTTGVASAGAIGTPTVVQPPTRTLTGVGGVASAEALGSVVVHAEAAIIAPAGIDQGAFGVLSVSNAVVLTGIASAEAFGTHRVRRLSDIDVDAGIASAEAFGALVLVHFQTVEPSGITSLESFGSTEVEDPHRQIFPFGVIGGEQFGIPTLKFRLRSASIVSAEQFGSPVFKVAHWKLVQPTRIERWRLGDPGNVIYVTNVVGLTVYGDDNGLFTIENPKTETLESAQYVWQGGHDNITTDQAIRGLWLANGYDVEIEF